MKKCILCNEKAGQTSELCKNHEFAMFQITEILSSFIDDGDPPIWLISGLRELAWIFNGHPRTVAFVNAAIEVADRFAIEKVTELTTEDIKEVNYTRYPQKYVIGILEEALLIQKEGDVLRPGPLTKRLIDVRDLGYPLNSPEQKQRALEYQGILALSLLRSMLKTGNYVPRGALAIITLLSIHSLGSKEIKKEISDLTWDKAFRKLPVRQENKLRRVMIGLLDGATKMIDDVNDKGEPELKPSMIKYLENMRQRYRDRPRTRMH